MKNNQQKRANSPSPAANISHETAINAGVEGIAAGVGVGPGLGGAKTTLEKATGQGSETFPMGGAMEGSGNGTGGERADESGISEWIEDLVGGAGEILENALSSTGEALGDVAEVAGEAAGAAVEGIVSAL